ncbi:MAG: hypothetical protein CSA70_03655 [Rhodobacterales bacterium]|nr:MAG: hypothetical protein CSA70_03655 [Rhodobacterales bacterium]
MAKKPMAKKPTTQAQNDQDNTQDNEEAKGPFVVVSSANGRTRRRAGLRFTPEGVKLDVSTLTEEQRTAIDDDPVLKISEFKEPAP